MKRNLLAGVPAEPPDKHKSGVYAFTCMRIFNLTCMKGFLEEGLFTVKETVAVRTTLNDLHKRGIISMGGLPKAPTAKGCGACNRRRHRNGAVQVAKIFQASVLRAVDDPGAWSRVTAVLHGYMAAQGVKDFATPAILYAVLRDKTIREIDI